METFTTKETLEEAVRNLLLQIGRCKETPKKFSKSSPSMVKLSEEVDGVRVDLDDLEKMLKELQNDLEKLKPSENGKNAGASGRYAGAFGGDPVEAGKNVGKAGRRFAGKELTCAKTTGLLPASKIPRMEKVKVIAALGGDNRYSACRDCYSCDFGLAGFGSTAKDAIADC